MTHLMYFHREIFVDIACKVHRNYFFVRAIPTFTFLYISLDLPAEHLRHQFQQQLLLFIFLRGGGGLQVYETLIPVLGEILGRVDARKVIYALMHEYQSGHETSYRVVMVELAICPHIIQ